jgi:hypothetical protein
LKNVSFRRPEWTAAGQLKDRYSYSYLIGRSARNSFKPFFGEKYRRMSTSDSDVTEKLEVRRSSITT